MPQTELQLGRVIQHLDRDGDCTVRSSHVLEEAPNGELLFRKILHDFWAGPIKCDVNLDRCFTTYQALRDNPHPNLLPPIDFGVDENREFWVTFPYVEHPTLDETDTSTMTPDELYKFFTDLFGAVEHLRNSGIQHGDIRAKNIFVIQKENGKTPLLFDYDDTLAGERGYYRFDYGSVVSTFMYVVGRDFLKSESERRRLSELLVGVNQIGIFCESKSSKEIARDKLAAIRDYVAKLQF